MAQHDFVIDNQGFPAFRSDLNNVLSAIASNSSGATEPTTTYAYQWWYDSTTDTLKMRNADDDAWISIGTFNQTTDVFTPTGSTTDKIEEGNSSVEVVDTGTGYVVITVDGVEASRIDSSGNVLVGKTASSFSTQGVEVKSDRIWVTRDGGGVLDLNRKTTDGAIAQFYKDGTTVGSIGVSGTNTYISGTSTGSRLVLDGTNNVVRSWSDDVTTLGASGQRFKNLYLSGGVYLGGTGSANYLDDYEEGTFTPTIGGLTTDPSSVSYGSQFGIYTKVGNQVTCHLNLRSSSATPGSGNLLIEGMPFNCVHTTNKWCVGSIGYAGSFTSLSPRAVMIQHNTTYLQLWGEDGTGVANSWVTSLSAANYNGGEDIWLSISYTTNV